MFLDVRFEVELPSNLTRDSDVLKYRTLYRTARIRIVLDFITYTCGGLWSGVKTS